MLLIPAVNAQDCDGYFPYKEGTTFEITQYDKKDKVTGRIVYKVTDVDASSQTATYEFEMFDKKDESIMTSSFSAECTGEGIIVDANYMVNPEMIGNYQNMEMTITGDNLEIPNNLSVGQTLPDAAVYVAVDMSPIKMNLTSQIQNRKVTAKESVTTPAGTFDCHVLEYETETKVGIKVTTTNKQWLAPKVGVIKDESYNKSGKLMGYSLLTMYSE